MKTARPYTFQARFGETRIKRNHPTAEVAQADMRETVKNYPEWGLKDFATVTGPRKPATVSRGFTLYTLTLAPGFYYSTADGALTTEDSTKAKTFSTYAEALTMKRTLPGKWKVTKHANLVYA